MADEKKKEFTAVVEQKENTTIYYLDGRLSMNTYSILEELFKATENKETIEIDMKNVTYIASAGLRVLMIMKKKHKGNVRITNCSENVKDIFEITGFSDMFEMS